MSRFERKAPIEQSNRQNVLEIDVGHVAIVHDPSAVLGNARDQIVDIIGLDLMLRDNLQQRVEDRLNRGADAESFDVGTHNLKVGSQAADKLLRFRIVRISAQKILLPLKDIAYARESGLDQSHCGDAVARRHSRKIKRL